MTEEDEEFNRIEREAKQRMEAVSAALDKKAENARELGLDYEPAQQEPVAFLVDDDLYYPEEIDWESLKEQGHTVAPLYTSPPAQRTWVGLMRGVRVEGDTVVITVKGGNDEARCLCGELISEMEKKT